MINSLLVISKAFGGNFGLAIIILTIIINLVILPLSLRQIRSMKAMQAMQPKLQEIQKKYAKDKQKLQQELMNLYKESGVNPLGCAFPLLIQMPIWIALYQSIMQTLPTSPERLLGLSQHLYSWSPVQGAVPPSSTFLGLNLAYPNFLLTILIMVTMWLSQKMITVPSTDPKQQQMQSMMQWMMPLVFGMIFFMFPSGLALYVVVGNIFRMAVQRFAMGDWGGLATLVPSKASAGAGSKAPKREPPPSDKPAKEIKAPAEKPETTLSEKEGVRDGTPRSKRKKRRRSG